MVAQSRRATGSPMQVLIPTQSYFSSRSLPERKSEGRKRSPSRAMYSAMLCYVFLSNPDDALAGKSMDHSVVQATGSLRGAAGCSDAVNRVSVLTVAEKRMQG